MLRSLRMRTLARYSLFAALTGAVLVLLREIPSEESSSAPTTRAFSSRAAPPRAESTVTLEGEAMQDDALPSRTTTPRANSDWPLRAALVPARGPGPEGRGLSDRACAGRNLSSLLPPSLPPRPAPRGGLFFAAVGGRCAPTVDATVRYFRSIEMDVFLIGYDEHDWSGFPWFRSIRFVREQGRKYALAKKYIPDIKVLGYSHVFLWDEDVLPRPAFDGAALLALLQALPRVGVAAPFVAASGHFMGGFDGTLRMPHGVHAVYVTPEMMCPIYSVAAWACIVERLVDERSPELWGVDSARAGCLCKDAQSSVADGGQVVFLHESFSVDHVDGKTQATFNEARARRGEQLILDKLVERFPDDWQACLDAGTAFRLEVNEPSSVRGLCIDILA